MPNSYLLLGDCRKSLAAVKAGSVDCAVTSPPYFGLRDYGVDGQIGLEQTPEDFVAEMVAVFRGVHRVLRDDGTLWLNLGDSYYNYRPGKGQALVKQSVSNTKQDLPDTCARRGNKLTGLKEKDLIGIPWRVALALQADGWYLRQDIIWHKPNPMPESVKDRCTKAHEYIFLLTKSPKYYFDSKSIEEDSVSTDKRPSALKRSRAFGYKTKDKIIKGYGDNEGEVSRGDVAPATRNRRSVWVVNTRPYKGAHFATYPPELIEPCILAGSRPGGIVLDPFAGSGTTGAVANVHGRQSILCELNKKYLSLIEERIGRESLIALSKKDRFLL